MKLNFKEKYLIILVAFCFIIVAFYYSYAIFVTKQLQENVVVIKVDNDRVILDIDGKDNKVSVEANSELDVKINLRNVRNIDYHYLVLVKGLIPGVKVSSSFDVKGIINSLEEKSLIVHITNTSSSNTTLEFMVKLANSDNIDIEFGYSYINNSPNFDHSGANKPDINGLKLIPVSYQKISDKEGFWQKVDESNENELWYSYENGFWANAVLLDENNYNKYKNSPNKTEIEIGDILGFYVWIPRYKYYVINNSNYTNYNRVTNIIFENEKNTSGTVICNDKISNLQDKHVYSEVCSDKVYNHLYDNLSTYTHPSFKDKTGFWVAKFLVGENERVLPNISMIKKNITEASSISKNNNSHVLTNMEYGAILLLSNSMYGKTGNIIYSDEDSNTFSRIYANTYEHEVTGCSSEYNIHSKNFITSTTVKCTEYNDLTNYSHISNSVNYPIGYVGAGASSTGNIYGVYDLANISGELVAAFIADENGNINIETSYYDLYSNNEFIGKIASSSNVYNLYRYKLGDGIREHYRSFSENGMWHNGMLLQNAKTGILIRGGNGDVKNASVYTTSIEELNFSAPFRVVLN